MFNKTSGFCIYGTKSVMRINNEKQRNMKNSHLEKSNRNQRIRKLLASGTSQAEVAREFNITPQRLNQLVQKWIWQGLFERTEEGFVISEKGRTPAKVIHNQKL
jgi:transposase-like protein